MKCGQSQLIPENKHGSSTINFNGQLYMLSFTVIETPHYSTTFFQRRKLISEGWK